MQINVNADIFAVWKRLGDGGIIVDWHRIRKDTPYYADGIRRAMYGGSAMQGCGHEL